MSFSQKDPNLDQFPYLNLLPKSSPNLMGLTKQMVQKEEERILPSISLKLI